MRHLLSVLALLAAGGLGAVEPPLADPLGDLVGDEDVPLAVTVTGIAAGAGSASSALTVGAASGNTGLVRVSAVAFDAAAGTALVSLAPVANANGATTLFVRIADAGGADLVLACRLTLRPQPDPPFQGFSAQAMPAGQLAQVVTAAWSIRDPDQPDPATLRYRLRQPPSPAVGGLWLEGVPLAAGDAWTQADIAAGRLVFRLDALLDVYTTVNVSSDIDDGTTTVANQLYVITVSGSLQPPPAIALPDAPPAWSEGAAPVAVCPGAVVTTSAAVTALAVRNPAGRSGDRLTLATGAGAGELAVEDGVVRVIGDQDLVGTLSGGEDGAPLVIASAALNQAVGAGSFAQQLLRALRFANAGRDPGQGQRPLELALAGSAGDLASAATAVSIAAVDDPPVVATTGIGTLLGLTRSVRLAADDPDSAVLRWSLVAAPDVAALTLAADGLCTIQPRFVGTADATVAVDDGVNPPQRRAIAVRVTGPDEPRPQPLAEPPAAAMAGETWAFALPWDAAVAVAADADAPPGLAVTVLDPATVQVAWPVPADAVAGTRAFALLATDAATLASGRLPVLLAVHPRPGAVR